MAGSGRITPRQAIAAECQRRGRSAVVLGCIDLLEGREADDGLILALGALPAEYDLTGLRDYWLRVRLAAERAVAALTASRA
jgi:hypothetical protein